LQKKDILLKNVKLL